MARVRRIPSGIDVLQDATYGIDLASGVVELAKG